MKDKIFTSDGRPPEPIIGSEAYQNAIIKADEEADYQGDIEDAKIDIHSRPDVD